MPWKGVLTVSDLRWLFVQQVQRGDLSLTAACRLYGISRKTACKWLARFRTGGPAALADQSRRPHHSPARTDPALEELVVQTHQRFHWGAAKIHAYLAAQTPQVRWPSITTVHAILQRHQRVHPPDASPPPVQRFEHPDPNDLWQLDFKGPLEIQRTRIHPLSILDDHSRYLLTLVGCETTRYEPIWTLLGDLMGDVGLPRRLLCDNYFNSRSGGCQIGLSWFDSQLLRLGIRPCHGRPFHPQTQGKIERFHRTLQAELWPDLDTSSLTALNQQFERWRTEVYNRLRPHEALAGQPPLARYRPSPRPRPASLPEVEYPAGSILRRVQPAGCISYRSARLLVGAGVAGQYIRLEEQPPLLQLFYGDYLLRSIPLDQLKAHTTI
jgi:transposase InsO family protein